MIGHIGVGLWQGFRFGMDEAMPGPSPVAKG